jgi:hypothetical protein
MHIKVFTLFALSVPLLASFMAGLSPRGVSLPNSSLQATGLPFYDDFETAMLDSHWSPQTTGAGVAELSTNYAQSGNQAVFLGQEVSGDASAELTLALDLSGQTDVFLTFWARATGAFENQRVYMSDNSGASWTQIADLDSISSNFGHVIIDLADVAATNGLALNDEFRIRFSYFSDGFTGDAGDGMVIDDVRLTQRAEAVALFPLAQQSFEATSLPQGFYPLSLGSGVAELTTNYAQSGNQAVFLGQEVSGDATARLTLALDLSGQTDVFLNFWARGTGAGEDRRVYMSDDNGASWTQIANLDSISSNFGHVVIDLADVADTNGLALNDEFRIRFSYFSDGSTGDAGDGLVIDDVQISSTAPAGSNVYLPLIIK